ncbi:MAG: flagellar biosynthesis protein FlhB [Defluviitaleaceae bacterium]|nr:flagellar biosynthesis protein FlhB [Defluviitaleaceae bacterium]
MNIIKFVYKSQYTLMVPIDLYFFNEGGGGQDKESKTEQPTPRKIKKAREEGQVAKSQEISTAISLLAMFFAFRLFAGWIYGNTIALMRFDWELIPFSYDVMHTPHIARYLAFLFQQVLFITLPLLAISFMVALVTNLIQVGWLPTSKPLKPKFSKLNPLSGFKRMFSMQSLVNLVKSLAKLIVVGLVVFNVMSAHLNFIPSMLEMSLFSSLVFIGNMVIDMALAVGALFIIVAALDYTYTRYSHIKKLRMTKQEVKDEYKQTEGDPLIKGKIRQKMREVSMRRMMQNVPEADVVITNPTHYAVALRYNNAIDKAPIVVAKGVDFMAKRIKEKAKENHVTVVQNPPLARTLYANVEIGDEIPYELWESVVEILAYVFKLKNRVS